LFFLIIIILSQEGVGSVNANNIYEIAVMVIPKIGLLFFIYILSLSITSGLFTVRHFKKTPLPAKALEYFVLCNFFESALFISIFSLFIYFSISILLKFSDSILPLALKIDEALALSKNHTTEILTKFATASRKAISYTVDYFKPHILFMLTSCFLSILSPYFYVRGWKYSLKIVLAFVASTVALKYLVQLFLLLYSNKPEIIGLGILIISFLIFIFFTLYTDIINPTK
jgi:hypothetical protein